MGIRKASELGKFSKSIYQWGYLFGLNFAISILLYVDREKMFEYIKLTSWEHGKNNYNRTREYESERIVFYAILVMMSSVTVFMLFYFPTEFKEGDDAILTVLKIMNVVIPIGSLIQMSFRLLSGYVLHADLNYEPPKKKVKTKRSVGHFDPIPQY